MGTWIWSTLICDMNAGTILCLRPANGRRRYIVTSSLIGRAHTQNDPCEWHQDKVVHQLNPMKHISMKFYSTFKTFLFQTMFLTVLSLKYQPLWSCFNVRAHTESHSCSLWRDATVWRYRLAHGQYFVSGPISKIFFHLQSKVDLWLFCFATDQFLVTR